MSARPGNLRYIILENKVIPCAVVRLEVGDELSRESDTFGERLISLSGLYLVPYVCAPVMNEYNRQLGATVYKFMTEEHGSRRYDRIYIPGKTATKVYTTRAEANADCIQPCPTCGHLEL
jgi:hypothetical protein